jgi:hypothetical protein
LRDAIRSTFDKRDTLLPLQAPLAFTAEFTEDITKQMQWSAFVRKGKLLAIDSLALNQIVPVIEKLIMPILADGEVLDWDPKTLEWRK